MTIDPKEVALMTEIRNEWGEVIAATCRASSVSPAFIAALVANESGGNVDAKRFEPGVLHSLWEMLVGRKATFGSILRSELLLYALPAALPSIPDRPAVMVAFSSTFQRIDDLATSWGLTQVMGYHVLEFGFGLKSTDDLILPSRCLPLTLRLLAQFAMRFELSLAKDFAELFDCWNTGEPGGKTADPGYIPRGLARMAIYGQLPPAEAIT